MEKQLESFHGDTLSTYQGVLWFGGLDLALGQPIRTGWNSHGLHRVRGLGGCSLASGLNGRLGQNEVSDAN